MDQVAVVSRDDMAAIYRDYWDLVYKRCLATLGDHEAAEDATQDVFTYALDAFEDLQHDIVRKLLDLARTISYERRRRPSREVFLANPRRAGGADDPADIAERHRVLATIWAGLSPVERRYVADKFAGFSFEEIAQRNGRRLGTVSSNLFRAREHARKIREPLAGLIGLGVFRRATDFSRRLRNAAHSSASGAAASPVQSLTISLTLAGLLVGVAPAVSAPAAQAGPVPLAGSGGAAVPPTQGDQGATAVRAAATGNARGGSGAAPLSYASGSAAGPSAAPPPNPLGNPVTTPPSSETPEDTQIYTATASPNYRDDHTILALGKGHACSCFVLLRSTDGGATWTSTSGVPDGDQIVLPPDYPRDPRIFVGYLNEAPGVSNWWTDGVYGTFAPLPGPPGAIALSAGFDAGDPRVMVSGRGGLWSYDMSSHVVRPLVVETQQGNETSVATPPGAPGAGVLAMTSSQAVTPGSAVDAATPSTSQLLWVCPPGSPCTQRGSVPLHLGARLAASPVYASDQTLLAYVRERAMLSADGGSSFSDVAKPADAESISSMALGASPTGGTSMWMVVQRGTGFGLDFKPTLAGNWYQVDHGMPELTSGSGRVIVIDSHRALYLSTTAGFVCTSNDGATWSSRCPAA
ncbi:MAG TPA: sigma-70 family RNA polymerase sigma factor [Candidatus Dormibacteraeota bacterium]|nr:sigma-70 family RNA polymerase sigma factor [Candidatus Dormibacteraeota bacterium]